MWILLFRKHNEIQAEREVNLIWTHCINLLRGNNRSKVHSSARLDTANARKWRKYKLSALLGYE